MWKLKQLIPGDDDDREASLSDEESDGFCSLSYTQRMYAFAACLVGGFAFNDCVSNPSNSQYYSPLATYWQLEDSKFLFMFGSTAFLIGPAQQLNMMFDSTRLYATAAYLGFVVIALISALWIHNKILTILAIICEICALIWYSLSYIPFARRMVSELMVRFCDTEL
ncbi:hypothetical protein Pint_17705 [Pistacia integerrima]|uniref:Uncharacterized protein n=1 Tax=Pistacia integerrima TaxID=434235 RepID=A0ACC0YXT5_9ROSI|nr:hypothetical protein Pint_17705 [Pistacia integerrima]